MLQWIMLRFYRLSFLLILAFVGVLVLIRLFNAGQASSFAALFNNPDGSICKGFCLFGVQPGETTPQTAVDLLQAHPLTRHLRQAKFAFAEAGPDHTTVTLSTASDGT